jgi:hypothetical protein
MSYFHKEKVLIIQSERFYADTEQVLRECFTFLQVKSYRLKSIRKYNAGSYEKMDASSKSALEKFYEPYNRELYEYLGVNFGWEG